MIYYKKIWILLNKKNKFKIKKLKNKMLIKIKKIKKEDTKKKMIK